MKKLTKNQEKILKSIENEIKKGSITGTFILKLLKTLAIFSSDSWENVENVDYIIGSQGGSMMSSIHKSFKDILGKKY